MSRVPLQTVWFLLIQPALLFGNDGTRSSDAQTIEFNRDIRPILSDRCFRCHGPDEKNRQAGLRLDFEEGAKRDIGPGRAVVPGNLAQSLMIHRITADDPEQRMPPVDSGKSLSTEEIELIKRWVVQGAPYQVHWSFEKPRRPTLPGVAKKEWPRNGIDFFVLARLEANGLNPSPEADRNTLIRRLSLDLIGAVPSLDEVRRFVDDRSPGAYERLVDRLLDSPHFGERMGRHWLDLARYADSNGYANDGLRSVWPYRDWVVHALNSDMPFDQFTREQLAGDLLPNATEWQRIATGFHRNTPHQTEGGSDPEQYRVERTKNRTDTTGAVWLGLTVGCAQCHPHKFDPISHEEYYQLYAFFNNADEPKLTLTKIGGKPTALVMKERGKPRRSFVQLRGDFLDPGEDVQPGTLSVLHAFEPSRSQSTRLDLADWLMSFDNPLTSRVQANRMWQHLFGAGLVETENDFGYQGSLPSHPALLDYLATELMAGGWKMKRIYKMIALSATYRQSSQFRDELYANDPKNRLLGRQNRYRVEGEVVRDIGLSVAGLLSHKMGGPAVFPPIPPNVIGTSSANHKWPESKGVDRFRRGLYTAVYRANVYPMLLAFDGPDRDNACTRRSRSNTPLQALTIANDECFLEMAQAFGRRLHSDQSGADKTELAFRLALSRQPSRAEHERLQSFRESRLRYYQTHRSETEALAGEQSSELASWISLARVMMNLDEFITRE